MPNIDAIKNEAVSPVRAPGPIAPVQGASGSAGAAATRQEADGQQGGNAHDQAASAAEYVRANARIADILADLSASAAEPTSLSTAEHRVVALLPEPVVIIPLPPASADMVQRAIQVAQEMAAQAAQSRRAQANVSMGAVNEVLAHA